MANLLLEQWGDCEKVFEEEVRTVMRGLRREERDVINHIASCRQSFVEFLRKPDSKQKLVHTFQVDFNAVDMELRALDQTKGHLHCLADDLRDALWAQCDEGRDAAEQERVAVVEDTFVGDHIKALTSLLAGLVHQETLRFQTSCNLARDWYKGVAGADLDDEVPEPHNALSVFTEAAEAAPEGEVEEGSVLKPTDVGVLDALKACVADAVEKLCVTPPPPRSRRRGPSRRSRRGTRRLRGSTLRCGWRRSFSESDSRPSRPAA
jgi:hypothetical protein